MNTNFDKETSVIMAVGSIDNKIDPLTDWVLYKTDDGRYIQETFSEKGKKVDVLFEKEAEYVYNNSSCKSTSFYKKLDNK